jgi:diguanylate cyclase (GGDEF)-like protein
MALIEPVSSLSIKRAVNLYTIILFLSFGVLLYWLATDRYQVFVNAHENTAHNTTKIIAYQTSKALKEKERIINIFIESNKDLINELSNNPDDKAIHQVLIERLKKYLPDLIAFNIISAQGEPVIGDPNGDLCEYCLEDINYFIKTGQQHIHLHPGRNTYHFDLISKYSINKTDLYFFVSFNASEISDLLNSTEPENHNLMVINKEANDLIEINSKGDRQQINDRLGSRMNGEERLRLLSTTKIKDTSWEIIDIHDAGLFDDYKQKIIIQTSVVFYIVSMIILFMRNILLNQDKKRTTAEELLQLNHEKIKELNNQLDLLSKTDSLTGLYNRRYFDEMINQEWNRGLRSNNSLSCILLDIDYFKDYNDHYGHQAGDKCLKDIATLMKDTFRRAGDIVARYGGEEFIVILANSSQLNAMAAIAQFQAELAKLKIPHEKSDVSNYVTVSAGIASEIPSREQSIEDFIRSADKALYLAKHGGRNQSVTQ